MQRTKFVFEHITPLIALMACSGVVHALPDPQVEWTLETAGVSGSAVAYPAEEPDSVVVSTGGRVVRVGGTGKLIFSAEFGPEGSRGGVMEASVIDLDGDGVDEIVSGHNDGLIVALNGMDGRLLWSYDVGTELAAWRIPVPVDLDKDGKVEVLASNMDGWIACINHDGTLRWRSKMEEYRLSTPAVGDINNDGRLEVVYGTSTRHLIALDDTGKLLWDRFHPPMHMGRTAPVIADLDEDGAAEVYTMSSMIAPDTGVLCVNGVDGAVKWVGETWHKAYHGLTVGQFADGTPALFACDKGDNVGAWDGDGKLRWRTQVSGRGIWTAPVQADVDGDGTHEILFSIRDHSQDGKGVSWYVLSAAGEVLGAYAGERGYSSPLVADVDQDGELEVVIAFATGQLTAFSFGGAATDGAVIAADWRGPAYVPKGPTAAKGELDVPTMDLARPEGSILYGRRPIGVEIPEGSNGNAVEVSVEGPGGSISTRVFRAEPGAQKIQGYWKLLESGESKLTLRLLEIASGKSIGQQRVAVRARRPDVPLLEKRDSLLKTLSTIEGEANPARLGNVAMLGGRSTAIRLEGDVLARRIKSSGALAPAEQDELAGDVDAYTKTLERAAALLTLVESDWEKGDTATFVLWEDNDPWDSLSPMDTLPAEGGLLTVDTWAFGREIESVAVNAVNLTDTGMILRVEPGGLFKAGEEKPLGKAENVATLMRTVWVPSRFGEVVPDLLPPLGDGYLIDIAPGEVSQLWINIKTHDLEPGSYELRWPLHTMDQPPVRQELTIALEVSTPRLPEKSRFMTGYWSRNNIGEFSTVENLNEHLQTLWYQLPLPSAQADATGKLTGTMDWSAHDAILSKAAQVDMILYSGPPVPKFPEGVEVTPSLQKAGKRSYFQAMVDHLAEFGLSTENFCFYVQDEPGLYGNVDYYLKKAQENREIDPRIQNYANPWGGVTVQNIRDMAPLTDVWQPGMETIEYIGPEYVDAMRAPGERIAMYTPPGNCRVLRPLGFYRAQPWQAFHWGIEGGGWWVYYQGIDLWATHPDDEPSYAAINYDGRALVNSRRWEAQRDGIEDFNALTLLSELADAADDEEAKQVIKEAVDYVAGVTITGMPRESADYDLDFEAFSAMRLKIRGALERLYVED